MTYRPSKRRAPTSMHDRTTLRTWAHQWNNC